MQVRSLHQRCQSERSRVGELEALLASMRAREFRSDLNTERSGGQLENAQERNRILEQQVKRGAQFEARA